MSKKAQKAYLELSSAINKLKTKPQCADKNYQAMFFVDPMPAGTPDNLAMRLLKQNEVDAKLICDFCPVKALCASYAIIAHEPFGIWGGTSPADRRTIYATARARATGEPLAPLLFD